nr:hypothetical protein Iba_chr05fCG0380 [Ipomoea batatas]
MIPSHQETAHLLLAGSIFVQDGGLCNHGGNNVRIHVGSRPSVLEVALAVFLRVPAHTNRRPSVCHSLKGKTYPFEGVDVGCLVLPGEATLVALTICSNVLLVPHLKLCNGLLNDLISPIIPH